MMHTHIISGPSYATEHHQLSYLVCDLSHHTHTHTHTQLCNGFHTQLKISQP